MPVFLPDETDEQLDQDVQNIRTLMLRLSWSSQRRMARTLVHDDLTMPQFMTLRAIQRVGEAGCTMTALAEAAYQVGATMTGIIARLEERELVQRQRDSSDHRVQRVTLTQAGQNLLEQIEEQQAGHYRYILQRLSAQDRQQILRILELYLQVSLEDTQI